MSPYLVFFVLFTALAIASALLLRRSVANGERLFGSVQLLLFVVAGIYLGAHSLLAFSRGF